MKSKSFGSLTFKIDRPKGFVKTWPTKSFTYPCDYGYFPRLKGEDGEGLDAFVGDDLEGHLESFLKLKQDEAGKYVPDETKFILGCTDAERETIYKLYGMEAVHRKVYASLPELQRDLERFKPVKKSRYAAPKAASLNARPTIGPGEAAGIPLWRLKEEALEDSRAEAEAMRAAAVKTKGGKNIPPLSEVKQAAIKAAAALYGVKAADLDKVLEGNVLFADNTEKAHVPEATDKADKLDRVFKAFDDKQDTPGEGTESSHGAIFDGGAVG